MLGSGMSDPAPTTPKQFNIGEIMRPRVDHRFRRLPRLVARGLVIVWRAAPRELVTATILQVIVGVGLAIQVLVAQRVLSKIIAGGDGGDFADVVPSLVALMVVGLVISLSRAALAELQRVLSEMVARYAISNVLDVAAEVDLIAFEDPEFANRLQRAQVNAVVRPVQMTNGLLGIVGGLIAVAGVGVALLVLSPVFFVIVLIATIPAAVAANRGSRLYHRFAVEQTEPDRRRLYLLELLSRREHSAEMRSLGITAFLRSRYDDLYEGRIIHLRSVIRRRLRLALVGQLITTTITFIGLSVLVWQVTNGTISAASGGAAAGAMVLLAARLSSTSADARQLYESSLFLEDFTEFIDALPGITAGREGRAPAPARFSRLVVDRIGFTYPNRSRPALSDVSLEIGAGEIVALVGENGSGKTTLAKLLAGLYEPGAGVITWDGVDVATFDPALLRVSVAVLFQDFVRYHFSARENIGLGRHERIDDADAIERAARAAGVHEAIAGLDDGYESRLGPHFDGGTDLSIGQWQRVALARALFRDSPFVILDEPTASLDARAERALFDDVRTIFPGRAVLLISHRFANVRSADRIYVLSDGRVVESGAHQELLATDGLYAELFTLQASTFWELDDEASKLG
jgi:ATP-binding cassette, subfamily B, bacterial